VSAAERPPASERKPVVAISRHAAAPRPLSRGLTPSAATAAPTTASEYPGGTKAAPLVYSDKTSYLKARRPEKVAFESRDAERTGEFCDTIRTEQYRYVRTTRASVVKAVRLVLRSWRWPPFVVDDTCTTLDEPQRRWRSLSAPSPASLVLLLTTPPPPRVRPLVRDRAQALQMEKKHMNSKARNDAMQRLLEKMVRTPHRTDHSRANLHRSLTLINDMHYFSIRICSSEHAPYLPTYLTTYPAGILPRHRALALKESPIRIILRRNARRSRVSSSPA